MEATVAAPVPPSQTSLSAQASTKTGLATQSPSRNNIMKAAQESLERAILTAPATPKKSTPLTTTASSPQSLKTTIVTAQGTWQNVVAPSSPEKALPAVQNFLQMAFETVQRSQQDVKAAAQVTLQKAIVAHPLKKIETEVIPLSIQPTLVATSSPPRTAAPFHSLKSKVASTQPHKSVTVQESLPIAQVPAPSAPEKRKSAQLEQPYLTKTMDLTSQDGQTSNAELTRKAFTFQTGTTSKRGQTGYSGYTIYNTAWPANPKPRQIQNTSPVRSVLVAKRRQSPTVPKTEDATETELSPEKPLSPSTSQNTPTEPKKGQSSSPTIKPQSTQAAQISKDEPIKHSTSRVAQTYQTFKASQRNSIHNGPKTSTQSPKKSAPQNSQPDASGSSRSSDEKRAPVVEIDPKRRVLVSGFPPYTQPQDLTRVLSTFGNCQVDKCRNRLAVVTFSTEFEARSAMKASDELCIYGDFIEINPYTNNRHVEDMFKAYKKVISTDKGQDIIKPNNIDLTGDFYQQLENIQNAIRLTREQVQAITNLYIDLEMVLQQEWPGCVAVPFGSIPTGLGIKSSDADCYVELPPALRTRGGAGAFVSRARRLLALYPRVFSHLVAIPRANTPIVKFRHVPSGFHCDLNSKTPLGAQNTKLIKLLLEHDPRLSPVAVLLKYWAKVHELSGTGRLTNYALTMMVVFYFQQPQVGLVPAVELLQRDPAAAYIVDHWNAGFVPRRLPSATNNASLPELLGGFFRYYSTFDFDDLVVCPYLGVPLRKVAFDTPAALPMPFARYASNVRNNLASPIRHNTPFCVQDPFEQSHNVASSVSARLASDIRAYIKFAADAYTADRVTGCRNFLRTILLTRPRIRRDRMTPTSKVYLIPRVRGVIADEDWRSRAREIILEMIFEKILKIKLKRELKREEEDEKEAERIEKKKEEEKQAADERKENEVQRNGKDRRGLPKMDKEKYSGSATKPVWRRKKNYSVNAPEPTASLISRQAAATDDILAAATDAPLEFELELWFRDEPRHFYVFARLGEGELDVFRQFVAFMHTAMFDWFKILVRPFQITLKPESTHVTQMKDSVERSAARKDCTIEFEQEPDTPTSPVRLVLDPSDITRDLNAVTLDDATADTDTDSADSSKKDPTDTR